MSLLGINRIILAVHDLEKSKAFFTELLGASFEQANWTGVLPGYIRAIRIYDDARSDPTKIEYQIN